VSKSGSVIKKKTTPLNKIGGRHDRKKKGNTVEVTGKKKGL